MQKNTRENNLNVQKLCHLWEKSLKYRSKMNIDLDTLQPYTYKLWV